MTSGSATTTIFVPAQTQLFNLNFHIFPSPAPRPTPSTLPLCPMRGNRMAQLLVKVPYVSVPAFCQNPSSKFGQKAISANIVEGHVELKRVIVGVWDRIFL